MDAKHRKKIGMTQSLSTFKSSRSFSSIMETELSVIRFLGKSYSLSSPCILILVFLLISLLCLFQSKNSCSKSVPSHCLFSLMLFYLYMYSVPIKSLEGTQLLYERQKLNFRTTELLYLLPYQKDLGLVTQSHLKLKIILRPT